VKRTALDRVRARRKSPEYDPLLAAICDVCKVVRADLDEHERAAFDSTVTSLIRQGAKPTTVRKRAASFRRLYPGVKLTPAALDRAWPVLE